MIGYFSGILNHVPKAFITETDWRTSAYSGQVLFDWEPKNQGGPTSSISFTMTMGSDISASVAYSVANPAQFSWKDQTNPSTGDVKTEHTLDSATTAVTYTVKPSSIGYLDSNKSGGAEPMLVGHYIKSKLVASIFIYEWADLSFSVSLRSSGVSQY